MLSANLSRNRRCLRAEPFMFASSYSYPVREEDERRLSPLPHDHLNMLGRYSFLVPEAVAKGQLRPLRDPADPNS